jgi:hypothetical protein
MKRPLLFVLGLLLSFTLAYGIAACGDGGLDSCPGVVCTNCAGADCNVNCNAGETEFCGAFGFFEDPSLRCAWCSSDPDPFGSVVGSPAPTAP